MKLSVPICLALLATLAGCSSTQYIMSTKEGRMIVADGKPDYDEKAGSYEYRDAEGKRMTIMKSEVVQIMER
ncbi:MAG: YgdI/YgdR family lipoprotein [Paucibacter sp.]|nr:YgdI/YgdR family lipoprotein [Roseateles sp.]